jgi:hypothetical protein
MKKVNNFFNSNYVKEIDNIWFEAWTRLSMNMDRLSFYTLRSINFELFDTKRARTDNQFDF